MALTERLRVAVIGSGVSGLVCAHRLREAHEVTLFEADRRLGGHTNTVEVEVGGDTHVVDTGFIVYNTRSYPAFTSLLHQLGVATRASDMSFGVSDERTGIEWRGTSLSTVFAQPRNAARPAFVRMVADIARFNRYARAQLAAGIDPELTLADVIERGRWAPQFVDWYLVPLGSAIWSADPRSFASIPFATFARFFDNHGLLSVGDQPEWRTIVGGSARYVDAIAAELGPRVQLGAGVDKIVRRHDGVELHTTSGPVEFDHVVVATHSDQALRLLGDPTPAEREVLGAIRFQPNAATLHTDERLLPLSRRARASWNYHCVVGDRTATTVTYDMSRLQGIESSAPLLVTLNRDDVIDPSTVLDTFVYDHPVLDAAAVRAQRRYGDIGGRRQRTSYAGAYWGYGFHEDGVQSAIRVCADLGVEGAW
jgi:uncharacterized protein